MIRFALFLTLLVAGTAEARETVTCSDGTVMCCDIVADADGNLHETNCDSGACAARQADRGEVILHPGAIEAARTLEKLMSVACDDRSGTCELATEEISAVLELLPNFKVKAEAKARR